MTLGIIILLIIWGALVVRALQQPWIGVVGYAAFAVLCPTWNWRWGLPEWDYQKFLAGATIISWAVTGLSRQRLTNSGKWTLLALSSYLTLSFVSSFQSISPEKTALFMDVSWKMVLMVVLGAFLLRDPKKCMVFLWALILSQGWNALNVNQLYYQYGINTRDFRWNFLDNNTYSISTVPIIALAVALVLTSKNTYGRMLAGFTFVLQMHQLMFLESRGTMLGGIAVAGLAVFFMPKTTRNLTYLGTGLLAATLLAGPSVVKEFSSSFESDGGRDSSAASRFYLWKAGSKIMMAYPVLGVGPWGGEMLVPSYYEGPLGEETHRKALHNLFFEVGTGSGIPALICYLLAFWIPWWSHFKLWRFGRGRLPDWLETCNLAVLCGIPGYWVASMFSSGALIESPYLLIVVGTASLAVHANAFETQPVVSDSQPEKEGFRDQRAPFNQEVLA